MRVINLKTRPEDFVKFKDRELLATVVEWVNPEKGVNYKDMALAIALADKIKGEGSRIVLEDADWKKLCDKLEVFPWAMSDRDVLELVQSVIQAHFVKPEELESVKTT